MEPLRDHGRRHGPQPRRGGLLPQGKPCSFEEAVSAYSINVAKERRIESEFGSIEEGKFADFVIWDKDAMDKATSNGVESYAEAVASDNIHFAKEVYFKGENVYTRS